MSWKPLFEHPLFRVEGRALRTRTGEITIVRMDTADWVNVVAVTADDHLVLVRQHRFGLEAETLEIPGGMVDVGEAPEAAAVRELREETGYGGGEWSSLGHVHPNPAIQTNRTWMFLARGVVLEGPQQPDPSEQITVELHPAGDLLRLLREHRITHALAVAALQRWLLTAGEDRP